MSSLPRVPVLCAAIGWLCLSVACGGSNGLDASGVDAAPGGSSSGASSSGGSSSGSGSSSGAGSSSGSGDDGDDGGGAMPEASASGGGDADTTDGGHGGGGDAGLSDAGGLNAAVSPGGNFDLSVWELQEPVGSAGAPTTILPAQLAGPKGFHDTYFFTDPTDGSMSFWDPEDGVTTANSDYPRSELREMTPAGAAANWMSTGTNTLSATVRSTLIPDHVAVGQIHLGTGTPASTKPLLELFYYSTGSIVLAIEQTPAGGNEVPHTVGNVPLGTSWSYVIGLSGNTITVAIDGGAAQSFAMSSTFDQEGMYFKAGDYDQSTGSSSAIGARVQFYALSIFHGP